MSQINVTNLQNPAEIKYSEKSVKTIGAKIWHHFQSILRDIRNIIVNTNNYKYSS